MISRSPDAEDGDGSDSALFEHSIDSANPLVGFRERAGRTLDDLALLRWRLGGVFALMVIAALVVFVSRQGSAVPTAEQVDAARSKGGAPTSTTTATTGTTEATEMVVFVTGAVRSAGVYRLPPSARVADAIDAAGGTTEEADLEQMNLAQKVDDGGRVYVIRRGQTPPPNVPTPDGAGTASARDGKVNLNTATVEQLDGLPGVGPATAGAIVSHRTEHGPFSSVDQLAEVKGIGPSKLAQIKDLARV